jgi:hypothetical protein
MSWADQGGGKQRLGINQSYVIFRNLLLTRRSLFGATWSLSYIAARIQGTVQGFAVDNAAVSDDSIYEVVTCALCRRVHLVNPATGRVAGANAKPGR